MNTLILTLLTKKTTILSNLNRLIDLFCCPPVVKPI